MIDVLDRFPKWPGAVSLKICFGVYSRAGDRMIVDGFVLWRSCFSGLYRTMITAYFLIFGTFVEQYVCLTI